MSPPSPLSSLTAPFVLELRRQPLMPRAANATHFTPSAVLLVGPELMESGLLRDLCAAQWQGLWWVLSCLTPDGRFVATPSRIASLCGQSERRVRQRLDALCRTRWRGEPLLHRVVTASGLRFYQPGIHLVSVRVVPDEEALGSEAGAPVIVARAEDVVSQSRARYGRPREQVEAAIHHFLQRPPTESLAAQLPAQPLSAEEQAQRERKRRIVGQLRALGLEASQIASLLSRFDPGAIEAQLRWLPYRQARRPAAYLLRAVEGRYGPPSGNRDSSSDRAEDLTQVDVLTEGQVSSEGEVLPASNVAGEDSPRSP